jgi:hypothetical protein
MKKQVIEIRGHHLETLKEFLYSKKLLKNSSYDKSFDLNRNSIYDSISRKNHLIKITAKFDSICSKCDFKNDDGCRYEHIEYGKVFQRKKYTRETDLKMIKKFGLELNKIYTGKEISKILLN